MKLYCDSIATTDILGRGELSKKIAEGLILSAKAQSNGFVTGVTGKWGSGKSTLLNFLKEDIRAIFEKEKIDHLIIEFNPWMFADKDNIRVAMLRRLSANLTGSPPWWKRILIRHSGKLEYFELAHSGLGKVGKEAGKLIQNYLDTSNPLALKRKIDELLVMANKKIFVFIDDIDRLAPKQIFEILQVLKLSGNFSNTFYIIAYDREAVETAIETQFQDYGKKYLDKIVQADFLIPEASDEKIEQLLFNGLDNICSSHDIKYSSTELSSVWLHRGLRLYFSTVRDVYRYLNSIQFSLPVIHNDVDITDFLTLEAVRVNDFEAYQMIYDEYNKSNFYIGATINLSADGKVVLFKNETTKKLIQFLFPKDIVGVFSGGTSKRLYDPKNFPRYFTLQLSNKDISELEFERFMGSNANRFNLLKDIMDLGRLDNLLIRLNDSELYKKYNLWDFSLVDILFNFFNAYSDQIKSHHRYADAIINLLHQKKKEQNIYFNDFIQLLISPTREVQNARIYFLHFLLQSKEKDNGFPGKFHDFKDFYLSRFDQINTFYQNYLTAFRGYFMADLIPKKDSYYTLLFIYDISLYFPTEYFNWVRDSVRREENILFFLKNILMIDTDGESGRINLETLNVLIPGKEVQTYFARTLKQIDMGLFNEKQKQWREFALEYFKEIEN
jgi:hypothetical protein